MRGWNVKIISKADDVSNVEARELLSRLPAVPVFRNLICGQNLGG